MEALGVDPFGGAVEGSYLRVSGFVVEGMIYYGREWRDMVDERPMVTTNPDPLWDSLARTELRREYFMGIEICGELYSWLPDYAVDSPGLHMLQSGSKVICLLCCDGGGRGCRSP